MPVVSYTRENIERFARSLAHCDREHHPRLWVSNRNVVVALRGHALCFANAHRIQVVLTHAEIAFGLNAYRRARGLRRPSEWSSRFRPITAHRDRGAEAPSLPSVADGFVK
jgi:hypothetical protein